MRLLGTNMPARTLDCGGGRGLQGDFMTSHQSRAERFRAKADERERQASHSRDYRVKAQFLDSASHWRHLAGQAQSIANDRESVLKMLRTVGK
jgi:hypothetical protein